MPKYLFFLFFLVVLSLLTMEVSAELLVYRGAPGRSGAGKRIVLVSGDEEYRSEQLVVQLGRILSRHHGFDCHLLFAIDRETGEIDPTILDNIPGLEALDSADLMLIATRYRNLPDEQMRFIDAYLMRGGPVIGLRTATHAFKIPRDRAYARYSLDFNDPENPWHQGFGRLVLGETWIAHHGKHGAEATRGEVVADRKDNPILRGCDDIFGPTDVYRVRLPLPEGCVPLVNGIVLTGMKPDDPPLPGPKNDPKMPIVWTKSYRLPGGVQGYCLTSTMGSAQDFSSEGFRRLLVNGVYALTGLADKIPAGPAFAEVSIVGDYEPLPMGFAKHRRGCRPEQFRLAE